MKLQFRWTRTGNSFVLTLTICLAMLLNTGIVAYAQSDIGEVTNDECPESLLLRGKELLKQVPDFSAQFPGGIDSEVEAGEQGWFAPRLPDWFEIPSWSLPSFEPSSTRNEGDSDSHFSGTDQRSDVSEASSDAKQFDSSVWVKKAEALLKSHGFEDSDGDGNLNWPEDSPVVGGQNLDIVVVVTESSGIVIGFVPIAGDALDAVALVIARDPFTGECLSTTDQLLFALSLLLVIPVSANTLKLVGGLLSKSEIDKPIVRRTLQGTLKELDFETHTWFVKLNERFEWTLRVEKNVNSFNRVALKYWRFRTIAGRGATTSSELARKLGFSSFSDSNYREALIELTGRERDEVAGLEAHHILPREFVENFQSKGIDTINDPRLLVWVDPTEHHKWSSKYSQAWKDFFELNPNASQLDILDEARVLADEYGYRVLFRSSSWNLFKQIGWPLGG